MQKQASTDMQKQLQIRTSQLAPLRGGGISAGPLTDKTGYKVAEIDKDKRQFLREGLLNGGKVSGHAGRHLARANAVKELKVMSEHGAEVANAQPASDGFADPAKDGHENEGRDQ